jgi:hypothetical protein
VSTQYKAVTLSETQVALATLPASGDMRVGTVQIMSMGPGVLVSGVDALLALREAVDFALGDSKS